MVVLLFMETPGNHIEIYAELMKTRVKFSHIPYVYGIGDIKCNGCDHLEKTACAWYCNQLKCSLEDGSVMAFKCLCNSCLSEVEKENKRIADAMSLLFSYPFSGSQSRILRGQALNPLFSTLRKQSSHFWLSRLNL